MAKLLVVDDSEDVRDSLSILLELDGHEVRQACDGADGLRAVVAERPDVVLLDMMMPDVDGLEFLARLPSVCAAPLPAVIACSGIDAYREEAVRRGACAFLGKPVELDVLQAAVRAASERAPVAETVLADNQKGQADARRRAETARAAIVDALPPATVQAIEVRLRALTRWLREYYGFGATFVQLSRGDELCVEAQRGGSAPWLAGYRYPQKLAYCNEVIVAGSTVVLCDPVHHPLAIFSEHAEIAAGFRFYAGVPLTTWSGAVIGTLCMVDVQPREVHAEDMRLLEALGLHVAHALEELAAGGDVEDFVIDEEGLLSAELLQLVLQVDVQRAARSGGTVCVGRVALGKYEDATRAAHACYEGAAAPGLAVAHRRSDELVVLSVDGPSDELVVRSVDGPSAAGMLADAVARCMTAVPSRLAGSATCRFAAGTHDEAARRDSEIAEMLLRAADEATVTDGNGRNFDVLVP